MSSTSKNEPKTRPTGASVDEFLAGVDEKRRDDCAAIRKMMHEATGEPAEMWGAGIIGFGRYVYTNTSSKNPLEWPLIGFSPRKNDLTLYITNGFGDYSALLAKLGKHKTSKACLYLKRLSDVDVDVLRQLIDLSVAHMEPQRVRK